jgi:hypothetical protein
MKFKFFYLTIIFLGISSYTFAQAAVDAAPIKQDAPKQEVKQEKGKTADCPAYQAVDKTDCKWVDANNDGRCDTCGKKNCGKKVTASTSEKCPPAACSSKSATKARSCCSSKGGKKIE